ncbi:MULTISPECIES: oligosaccharide flippase family protein [Bradyrhizobium]|uniref:Membrane protein involved in the export of O-antigen and teichoic acid n=2 Tax=Bradyrhizobium TaxID=374 RepID=A0ABY0Q796_9BRAD|nr:MULTISPECIES: oligosaccharide flippase family protein [Bradyrhizobium]SDJ63712.1 Membrane protein involved in the export of O-antigen and teichoic acid [Bradyrhizobium ottawaense]SEC32967.1 Membrane protein involved in the export of O-antigen and teichoic acid [Bradyrhizobium lablabi]
MKYSSPHNPRASLKRRFAKAASWVLIGQFTGNLFRLGGNLILARLMAPDAFGIMAVAGVIHVIVALLADIGLRQAVIQSPNGERHSFLDTAWTLQILRGLLIWAACIIASLGLRVAEAWTLFSPNSVYANSILPAMVFAVSFSAVINGFQSMKGVSANRAIDLKHITIIEMIAQISSLCLAIGLSWLTGSVWSFVASGLFSSLTSTTLSHAWLKGRRDRIAWDREALSEFARFGRWVFVSSLFYVLATNGDRLLLGAWATPAMLGYYSIAFALTNVFDSVAARLFGSVSMPALSEIARSEPQRLPRLFWRMRAPFDVVFIALAGFLFAAGPSIVAFLYDARYSSAGSVLSLLSLGLLFSRYNIVIYVYLALGFPKYQSIVNAVRAASLFLLVPMLYSFFGFNGAVLGVACHPLLTLPLIFWFNSKHGLNNLFLEVSVLAAWPIGWGFGYCLTNLLQA